MKITGCSYPILLNAYFLIGKLSRHSLQAAKQAPICPQSLSMPTELCLVA